MLRNYIPFVLFTLASTSAIANDPTSLCQGNSANILEGKTNLIINDRFISGSSKLPQSWQLVTGKANQIEIDSSGILTLRPDTQQSVKLAQQLSLKPRTLYTLSVCVKGDPNSPPTVSIGDDHLIEPGVQRVKTQSYLEPEQQLNVWTLYRFVFYTTTGSVKLNLSGFKNGNHITQQFKSPIIVEGDLAPPIPELPSHGENMILNSNFQQNSSHWIFDKDSSITKRSCDNGTCFARLTASPEFSARVVQSLAYGLTPGNSYTLKAKVKTTGNDVQGRVFLTIKGEDPAPKSGTFTTNGSWQTVSYTFTAPKDSKNIKVMLESYKQSATGSVDVTDIQLIANGSELYPSSNQAPPQPKQPLVEDFSQYKDGEPLNSSAWLLPNKTWGGDNNGVVGKNVHFASDPQNGQFLRLSAFGSNAAKDKVRQGAAIATKNYYASGVYLICARMPQNLGVVSAFWPFHYIAYKPTEKQYWQEPNPIRNTEIDWELPTSNLDNSVPVSYQYARLNSWGGQFGGEGGNDTQRVDLNRYNDNRLVNEDNAFHQYGIIWYAGHNNPDGTRVPGYVQWTFNKNCQPHPAANYSNALHHSLVVVQNTKQQLQTSGQSYGQDNVPFRAARFWLGAWFPGIANKPYHAGGQQYWGWGGTPNFTSDHLDIKWVAIYPWSTTNLSPESNRDKWEAETAPDAGNWSASNEYPLVGQKATNPTDPEPPVDNDDTNQPASNGTVSLDFATDFPNDKQINLMWVEDKDGAKIYQQQTLSKSNNGFKFTPSVGSQIIIDGNVCWDNSGDTVRNTTQSIFVAVQKTWIKCRLQ